MPNLAAAALMVLGAALAAQDPQPPGAGFGAVYRRFACDAQTGAATHLGVAVGANGRFYVSAARTAAASQHLVYEFDGDGVLRGWFPQPAAQQASGFGMRDLDGDGLSLLGGSEVGISVFGLNGLPSNALLTANGLRPIVQPITGQLPALLAVCRAVAFDRFGNGGNGSLLVADFASPIYEVDLAGNLLATFPYGGWSAYGLAIDAVTRNVWVHAGPGGRIEELDRATMVPTGRSVAPIDGGAPGGLALASPTPGHHEPWSNRSALVHLVQGGSDTVAVQRLHLHPARLGWDEVQLRVGRNAGPRAPGSAPFWRGDVLDYELWDPTGLRNGGFALLMVNVYGDAAVRGRTDGGFLQPGLGALRELRVLSGLSVPSTPLVGLVVMPVGGVRQWVLPSSYPIAQGDLFRAQALVFDPSAQQADLWATNEAWWRADSGERGIVVAARGPTSYQTDPGQAFWSVTSDLTHGHGAILAVEITNVGATGSAASLRFDVDQDGMSDRFDGGNATAIGRRGTYRGGSAAACGLDFGAAGVYVAPFHGPGESCGAAFPVAPDAAGYVDGLRFSFSGFLPGRTLRFDCDTDGGPTAGNDHAGLVVRVHTSNSGVLTGTLQPDPAVPDRAVVWFP
jgi:hypothetical protein